MDKSFLEPKIIKFEELSLGVGIFSAQWIKENSWQIVTIPQKTKWQVVWKMSLFFFDAVYQLNSVLEFSESDKTTYSYISGMLIMYLIEILFVLQVVLELQPIFGYSPIYSAERRLFS